MPGMGLQSARSRPQVLPMNANLSRRRLLGGLSVLALAAAGCQSVPAGLPADSPQQPSVTQALPPAKGEVIGSGAVRVART